ncbi:MAG: polyamine aminopropyltransferase [Oligoflexia bacterium]|nr:polyamine aminopropyltransferase [Oligoflexia bacterium]
MESESNPANSSNPPFKQIFLLLSVFIIAFCSLIYELLIGSASSYFLGDSVTQFSITIGFFMTGMGIGSYLSRFIKDRLLLSYINIEIMLGLVGGISIPILYLLFAITPDHNFTYGMILFTLIIGVLIGLEIPLLTRILSKNYNLRYNLSNVLAIDYLGALIATLLFPFILLPFWGTFKTSLIMGLINIAVGYTTYFLFRRDEVFKKNIIIFYTLLFSTILIVALYFSSYLIQFWNDTIYGQRVLFSKKSKYQEIVLTTKKGVTNLYLNGGLQFSTLDEYRYHESLGLMPLLILMENYKLKMKRGEGKNLSPKVLILGGGDGNIIREILKIKEVQKITLVDIDEEVVNLAKNYPLMRKINKDAFWDKRVHLVIDDAFHFLSSNNEDKYDLIIADFPDPNNQNLAKLYSLQFYRFIKFKLEPWGIFATHASNLFHAYKTFLCINKTIQASGFKYVYPYHIQIPSFGEWGFILGSPLFELDIEKMKDAITLYMQEMAIESKFLTADLFEDAFIFPKDRLTRSSSEIKDIKDIKISTLENPNVLFYYQDAVSMMN